MRCVVVDDIGVEPETSSRQDLYPDNNPVPHYRRVYVKADSRRTQRHDEAPKNVTAVRHLVPPQTFRPFHLTMAFALQHGLCKCRERAQHRIR